MTTYLICTDGTNGDVYPFVRLGQELNRRGHETILYTHQHYVATAERAALASSVDSAAAVAAACDHLEALPHRRPVRPAAAR
jgi:UDP:flavonoid glycosyltransferase YjiC (YdhE family)